MESYWLLLSQHYSGMNKKVFLAYPSISTIPETISESQIVVQKLNFGKSDLVSLFKQYKVIRQNKIGIIYFSDYPICNIKYFVFRMAGVKHIIVHEHVPGIRTIPGTVKRRIKAFLHSMPLICASGLIAATEYVRRRHIEVTMMPENKCYCASNGLPEPPVVQAVNLNKEFAIPDDSVVMVTTGRANKYKGIDFALTILDILVNKQKRCDVHYLFCGNGPDLEEFKSTAKRLGIEGYVTFTGQVDSTFPYLLSCDFAIHPSKGEVGYSLSILEYMQAGLPVIVPDNPSVCGATLNGVNGYIYKQDDESDAIDKVLKLLSNPELMATMGASGKQLVLEKYRLSNTHEQLLQAVSAITQQGNCT
jgi:glycosyltransferase involved in cell wall biosynthesis